MTIPAPANAIHPGLGRFEVFDVTPERLPSLAVHVACSALPFSVHAPLVRRRPERAPVEVFFLSQSPRREESFDDLALTLAAAARHHAEYVVTHLNWTEDTTSRPRAEALAYDAAARMAVQARAHRVPLHIECGGYSGAFHEAAQFVALARAFPDLGLCLDVGHVWLIAQARGRSAYRDMEVLAPYVRSMHLWAARDLATYRRHGHVPLRPSLSPADGWIDLRRAVAPVLAARKDCAMIFEYTWAPADDERVADGIAWASDLIARAAQDA